jgi:radical SAM protein with 4Fe4S-binding SPASM domain
MTEENVRQMVEVWGPFFDKIIVTFPENPSLNHQHPWAPELEQTGDFHPVVPNPAGREYCSLLYENSFIQPNGDVLACCHDFPGRLVLGNIMRDDFLNIYYGEKALQLRREFEEGNPVTCGNCSGFYRFTDEVVRKENAIKALVEKLHSEVKQS